MSSEFKNLRQIAVALTVVVFFLGVILLGKGTFFLLTWKIIDAVVGKGYDISCIISISFGAIFMIFSIFGLCSIFHNGYGMLQIYLICTGLVSLTMCVYGIVLLYDVEAQTGATVSRLGSAVNALPPEALPLLELRFKCCGVEKFTDYNNRFNNASGNKVQPKLDIKNKRSNLLNGDDTTGEPKSFREALSLQIDIPDDYTVNPKKSQNVFVLSENIADVQKNLENKEKPDENDPFKHPEPDKGIPIPRSPEKHGHGTTSSSGIYHQFRNYVVDWKEHLMGRWHYGIRTEVVNGLVTLPPTCCKIQAPTVKCFGDPADTWQDGCLGQIKWFWRKANIELSILFMSFTVPLFANILVLLVLKNSVKQNYY